MAAATENMEKGQQVATAGVTAAANVPPEEAEQAAAGAMRAERDRVNIDLPDELLDRMAKTISQQTISDLRDSGAFDPPPEPPAGPPNQAPPAPGEPAQPVETAQPGGEPAPAPKRTFADRYMGQ